MAKRSYSRKSKLDPFMDKVGILPDRYVAELAGVTSENVRAFRSRRGIPARWRGEGEPLPGEDKVMEEARIRPPLLPALPPRPVARPAVLEASGAGPAQGFRVTIEGSEDGSEFVVVGADIAQAAALACQGLSKRNGAQRIVAIEYLAEALMG